jgi:hypothetical protein
MKFLNTNGIMNIEERKKDLKIIPLTFKNDWLDLSIKEFNSKIEEMFINAVIEENAQPVVYEINFEGNEEELDWVLEHLIEVGIFAIVPANERKFEDMRPHARYEVADLIAANMISQRRLINYKSLTKTFTIIIKINNETVYELIKETE